MEDSMLGKRHTCVNRNPLYPRLQVRRILAGVRRVKGGFLPESPEIWQISCLDELGHEVGSQFVKFKENQLHGLSGAQGYRRRSTGDCDAVVLGRQRCPGTPSPASTP